MVFSKSLARELTLTAIGVFIVSLIILVSTQAIKLLGYATEGQIANEAVAALIGFVTLRFFPMLLILTVFVSVIIVLTRLWRDHEMVIWLCTGLSLKHFIGPVVCFSIPLSLLVGSVSLIIGPWAGQRSLQYTETLKHREDVMAISPGIFKEPARSHHVYFIENYMTQQGMATHIFFQEFNDKKTTILMAQSGHIDTDQKGRRVLILKNGKRYLGTAGRADYEIVEFKQYKVVISESQPLIDIANNRSSTPTLLLWHLRQIPDARAELMWRISMPISCFILSLLAIALSHFNPRTGHTYTIGLAILAYFFYQNALTLLCTEIGRNTVHFSSMFILHLIVLLISIIILIWRDHPAMAFHQKLYSLFGKHKSL